MFPLRNIFWHGYIENRSIPPPQEQRTESGVGIVMGVTVTLATSSLTAERLVQLINRRQTKNSVLTNIVRVRSLPVESSADDHTVSSVDSKWKTGLRGTLLSNFNILFKTYVNNYSTPLGKPIDNILNHVYLSRKTENNKMAYLGVHVCTSKTRNIYFDTDTIEAVLDTRCSVTLSSE